MVGILFTYWGGLFSGAMLVSGRVFITVDVESQVSHHEKGSEGPRPVVADARPSQ